MTNSMRTVFDRIRDAKLKRADTSDILTESVGVVASEDNSFSEISEEEIRNRFVLLKEGKQVSLEYLDSDMKVCEGNFVLQHGVLFQIVEGVPIRKDAIRVVFNSSLSKSNHEEEAPKEKESFNERKRRVTSLVDFIHRKDLQLCERNALHSFDHKPIAETPRDGSPIVTFWSLNEDRKSLGKRKLYYNGTQVSLVEETSGKVLKNWDISIFNRMTDGMTECRNFGRESRQIGMTEVEYRDHKFARYTRESMNRTLADLQEGKARDFDIEVLDTQGRLGKTNISITEKGVRAAYGRNPQNVFDILPSPVYLNSVVFAVKPVLEEKNKSYSSLNDAASVLGIEGLAEGSTEVWYTNDDLPEARYFRIGSEAFEDGGVDTPTRESLSDTHVKLGQIEEANLDQIYYLLQAPIWSPGGEAREFILGLGSVFHTSMSVGDIIVIDEDMYMVDSYGFSKIEDGKFVPFVVEDTENISDEGEEEADEDSLGEEEL